MGKNFKPTGAALAVATAFNVLATVSAAAAPLSTLPVNVSVQNSPPNTYGATVTVPGQAVLGVGTVGGAVSGHVSEPVLGNLTVQVGS